ncbi:MAG: hypothetical protein LC650_02705, partial [Actinobacteria bacterium]|nr:hypothetical protein [Actinomycetota bacterium]
MKQHQYWRHLVAGKQKGENIMVKNRKNRIVKAGAIVLAMGAPLGVQAATIYSMFVTTAADNTTRDYACSLREAIINANNNAQTHLDCPAGTAGSLNIDQITLDVPTGSTITLLSALPDITDTMNINNISSAIISGGAITGSVLRFFPATAKTLEINGLKVTNAGAGANGAAISMMRGTLKVSYSEFLNSDTQAKGGAIYLASGTTATVNNSLFSGNSANGGGGAIYVEGATLTLNESEIDGNNSSLSDGGGIRQAGGSVTINNSALINNTITQTNLRFGGALSSSNGITKLNNVTVAGNSGGAVPGLYFNSSSGGLANVTVINNSAAVAGSRTYGAGIDANPAGGDFTIRNTIVGGNTDSSSALSNCALVSVVDGGYNMELASASCFNDPTSIVNTPYYMAKVGSLGDHGGSVQSVNINYGLAVDGGDPTGCRDMNGSLLTRDARISTAVRSIDGNADGEVRCDIGAYEFGGLGAFRMSLDKQTVAEGEGGPVVTIESFGKSVNAQTQLLTTNGTALSPGDYTYVSLFHNWSAGGQTKRSATLTVLDDTVIEGEEYFYADLLNSDPGIDLVDTRLSVTIPGNDLLVNIDSAVSATTMNEESTTTTFKVRVTLSQSINTTMTVPFTLGGTAVLGSDYTKSSPTTNTLTFPPGATWAEISLIPINDKLIEGNETITVTLGA